MKKGIVYTILIATFLYGCTDTTEQETSDTTQATTKTEEHKHMHSDDIVLNDGKKWVVDKDMIVYIRNMENDVTSFNNVGGADYKQLAKKLNDNIDLLTSNCTMEGQAHDELHKWLIPYMTMVEEFSEANQDDDTTEKIEELRSSFKTFNQYFE